MRDHFLTLGSQGRIYSNCSRGPSGEWSATNKVDRLSRRVAVFSSGMIQAEVKDVEVSRRTRINCLLLRRTSAAKEMPTTAGGSFVVWFSRGCDRLRREAQARHVPRTRSIAFVISRA